jgi:antitoxin component of MazEF toxin-antitoxin module
MGEITFKGRKVAKTGPTTYVSFPEQALQALGWKAGEKVDLVIRNGEAVIRPQERQEELGLRVSKKQKARKR